MRQATVHQPNAQTVSPPFKTDLQSVPWQVPFALCQPFIPFPVFIHAHKSCNTRTGRLKLQSLHQIQNRQGDFPSQVGGNGRTHQITKLLVIRCQTETGSGIWRCLAIKVKVRRVVPDLRNIHVLTMPAGTWQKLVDEDTATSACQKLALGRKTCCTF